MQEELEQKSVAISIKAGKLTANLLKKALEKALTEMTKSQKNPKIYKGKQSVKHLVRQGAGVSNMPKRPTMIRRLSLNCTAAWSTTSAPR